MFERAVCCPVELFVSDWSPVQMSPTVCGVSECDREATAMNRPWPTRGFEPSREYLYSKVFFSRLYYTFCNSTLKIIELISLFLNKLTQNVAFMKRLVRDCVGVTTTQTAFIPWILQSHQARAAKEWHLKLGHTASFHIPSCSQFNIIRYSMSCSLRYSLSM